MKNETKGKLEGLLECFMTIFVKKKKKIIKEEDTTNQKVQSRKDINLLESFMTIYGNLNESFRDMKILESIIQE